MKILITGGAGFIGSHLCDRYVKNDDMVLCLDNFMNGNLINIRHLLTYRNFKLINGDIRDFDLPEKIMRDVDVIFHLAAQILVDRLIILFGKVIKMEILITGGAGFIGSRLAELLAKKNEVIVLDNLDSYYDARIKKENLKIVECKGAKFIIGDVTDYDFIEKIIKKNNIKIIFHEAARPGVRYSIKDLFLPNKVNVIGTLNILKASLDSDVKKVINTSSSSSVYGKVEYLPFDENHPTLPISPHAVSKLAAEHYCRVFHEVYGLKTISLRYFTVYGPRMRPDLAIHIFTKSILNNELPIIFGNGEQTRYFTYIDDIVDANLKLLKINRADGKVLNIGSGRRVTINYMIDTLKNLLNSDIKSKYVDPVKGDARDTLANIDKAKKLIGYEPKTSLEEGLRKFIEWYKKNPSFYG